MNGVVILGAGSSADFGVPILREVFKDASARRYLRRNEELHRLLQDTFWTPRGHDLESSNESLTIEEMLTVLRDWESEDAVPDGCDPPQFPGFRRKLYVLIERAVFRDKSSDGRYLNPLIETTSRVFDRTTWASFNWDCIFESSFWYASGPRPRTPYGGTRQNPYVPIELNNWHDGNQRHQLLKLHGSIGWWVIDGNLTYVRWARGGPLEQKWDEYAASEEAEPREYPVILEPSAYKYHDHPYQLLRPQWDVFFEHLCEADAVIVVGYSLPPLDEQARSKILTAFQVNTEARWAVIDPSNYVCNDYERLLGSDRLATFQQGLAGFNNAIEANLATAFPDLPFDRDEDSAS